MVADGGREAEEPAGIEEDDSDYFDLVYGRGRRQRTADVLRDRMLVRMVAKHAPFRRHSGRPALIDVGCGHGYLLERFSASYDVYGSDISEHAVEIAGRRPGVREVRRASAEEGLAFNLDFSVVLMVNVLEHLRGPARALACMRERIARAGICVVHLPTINNRVNRIVYEATYAKDRTHIFRRSGAEVRRLFESVGFTLREESYFPHRPRYVANLLKLYPPYVGVFGRR
jgi:2-polyprenyl-3-methyl-5-hydroxy-6-metoxy-1,4-benzoquinol methylase